MPWTAAIASSSTDYFNVCSSASAGGVPYHQGGGFQYAKTGNAYAGLLFTVGSGSGREYLQVQLTSPLIQNVTYYVEFYVNSGSLSWTSSSCNNIAANLSVNKPVATGAELPLTPHIMNPGNPIIHDTLNWIKISGCYTAQGGEEYITIGNFFDNANTQTTGGNGVSYYYVDDVKVEAITGPCVTGINELNSNYHLQVYPNPNNGTFSIAYTFEDATTHTFELYDLMGRNVIEKTLNGNEGVENINLNNINYGIYFYKVMDTSGKMLFSGKLAISK